MEERERKREEERDRDLSSNEFQKLEIETSKNCSKYFLPLE